MRLHLTKVMPGIRKRMAQLLVAVWLVIIIFLSARPTMATASSIPNGVYNGPGTISAHNSFENWLGSPVQYATDYVDYKGGWQYDFVDSKAWLVTPWGTWVKAAAGRKLVLGLPMLENSNYGQFSQGAGGAFDSYFTSLGNDMVGSGLGSSIIRLGYEANCNTIGPWQATDNPSGYIEDFRHIVSVMRAVPGSNFQFDWTLCNGWQNGHVLDSFASFYPGDDVVDIVGMDQYDVKWQDTTVTAAQRWNYNVSRYMGLQDHKNFAAAHGKPVSFPEWGLYKPGDSFAGGGDDPYFIDQMADWISTSPTAYQSYFNLNWGGGVLADFPNGSAEYRNRFGAAPVSSPADTTSPIVGFTAPTVSSVSGTVAVQASASDASGISRAEFYIDNVLTQTITSAPYGFNWNSLGVANGSHVLSAKAYDSIGNVGSTLMNLSVQNSVQPAPAPDTTPPVSRLVSPSYGSIVGSKVTLTASATDNVKVSRMEIYVDGVLKAAQSGPSLKYGLSDKTSKAHVITIRAYDTANNTGSTTVKLTPTSPGSSLYLVTSQ